MTKPNTAQWRMVITAGMGFFTDAYDLFVIGVVTSLLAPLWHLSATDIALLNGASLAAAALGAVTFGKLADKLGRKKMYGVEIMILFFGAIFSALASSFIMLFIFRLFVGFGIGGDYPTSAVVASEYAHSKNRGFLVLLVFAMQALGLIVGPLIASALLAIHLSPEYVWRLLLAFGAIPAASVFYLRRRLAETPLFLKAQEDPHAVSRIVSELSGHEPQAISIKPKLLSKRWLKCLIGTAGAWFLLDVAFYGNGVSSTMILNTLSPSGTLLQHILLSMLIFLCFAVPGYYFAAKYVDKIGRKPLQMLGFAVMALCYLGIACVPDIANHLMIFILLFGLSFFFVNFGPNTTSFLIPSEVYPTKIRATAHGLSAAIGKVGAFIGAFALPLVLTHFGLSAVMFLVSAVSFAGIFTTKLVPEMKGISLSQLETQQKLHPAKLKLNA